MVLSPFPFLLDAVITICGGLFKKQFLAFSSLISFNGHSRDMMAAKRLRGQEFFPLSPFLPPHLLSLSLSLVSLPPLFLVLSFPKEGNFLWKNSIWCPSSIYYIPTRTHTTHCWASMLYGHNCHNGSCGPVSATHRPLIKVLQKL